MKKVYTLEEARDWFLSHHSGKVICVKDNGEKECDCYTDAKEFYK